MMFVDDVNNQIGNAVINDPSDQIGLIDYAWSHAIISDQLYNDITKNCDFKSDNATSICSVSFRGFLEAYSDIDIYNIYGPVCLSSTSSSNKTGAPPKLNVAPRFFTRHVSIYIYIYISSPYLKFTFIFTCSFFYFFLSLKK